MTKLQNKPSQDKVKPSPQVKVLPTLLIVLSILLTACNPAKKTAQEVTTGPYFSLDSYFKAEINRLRQEGFTANKRIELDGEVEEQQAEKVDFDAELKLFREADINRPAWTDKYDTDSITTDGQLRELRYTARDTTLPTQAISIQFDPNGDSLSIQQISIQSQMETALSSSDKILEYRPAEGYRIEAQQSGRMTADVALKLEARFRKRD